MCSENLQPGSLVFASLFFKTLHCFSILLPFKIAQLLAHQYVFFGKDSHTEYLKNPEGRDTEIPTYRQKDHFRFLGHCTSITKETHTRMYQSATKGKTCKHRCHLKPVTPSAMFWVLVKPSLKLLENGWRVEVGQNGSKMAQSLIGIWQFKPKVSSDVIENNGHFVYHRPLT